MRKSIALLMVCSAMAMSSAYAQTKKAAAKPANTTQTKDAPQKANEAAVKPTSAQSNLIQLVVSDQEENPLSLTNENHKMLSTASGTWASIISFFTPQVTEPKTGEGKCDVRMLHGGRFLMGDYYFRISGQDFSATHTLGYDNATRTFVSTWMDNSGTGILVCTGNLENDKSAIVLSGSYTDPKTRQEINVKQQFFLSDDRIIKLESYLTYPGDKEFKNMEIIMKR